MLRAYTVQALNVRRKMMEQRQKAKGPALNFSFGIIHGELASCCGSQTSGNKLVLDSVRAQIYQSPVLHPGQE
jgi:L-fucose isomerase-like protein